MNKRTDQDLPMWVVYERPRDYPGHFVVRRHVLKQGRAYVDRIPWAVTRTLEEARAQIPEGAARIERSPGDDSVILETWL